MMVDGLAKRTLRNLQTVCHLDVAGNGETLGGCLVKVHQCVVLAIRIPVDADHAVLVQRRGRLVVELELCEAVPVMLRCRGLEVGVENA